MADFSMSLPARKAAMSLLARLDPATRDEFTTELLEALWDAHEEDRLPENVLMLLREWTARAHFLDSPVARQRVHDARHANAR